MHTDLDTAIRDALHEREIGYDDLRYPELRAPRRRFGGVAAAATAVAAVAAVAAVLAAVSWPDGGTGGGGTRAAGGGFGDVLGYQWKVSALVDADGELAVPHPEGAMIGFTHHGYVVGDDSVNSIGAHYAATATGYSVTDAATTLVACDCEPDRARVIAAVDAMFFATWDGEGPHAPAVDVAVQVSGDMLTLSANGVTLTLTRDGEQPELSDMASATASPSR
jgi:hypothetical protein